MLMTVQGSRTGQHVDRAVAGRGLRAARTAEPAGRHDSQRFSDEPPPCLCVRRAAVAA